VIARLLPVALLLAVAPAPETDPFLAAMAGKSGPEAVAAPSFDPDVDAASWTTRPRREIVDGLAARLLRGEAKGWFEKGSGTTATAPVPNRFPEGFEPGKVVITDRLAARIPADAAAIFFGSLDEAEKSVEELSKFLPRALPVPFADAPGGRRDALARAVERLLLPTIWRSNPNVRRGARQAALVASDPDLRWAPEVALVVEVDDASLVRFHRQSTISWEDRGRRHLRVDGLDVVADDGSVRSFFGLEGGIAVWSTGKAFRDRILAAVAGKAPTLLSPDPRAYALARATFPAADGGALLVVPDGFLERANSAAVRARRAASLRCDAVRLILDARALAKTEAPAGTGVRLACPAGGEILIASGRPGAHCSVHGSASHHVPLGDLPESPWVDGGQVGDIVAAGACPVAGRWKDASVEVFIPPGRPGTWFLETLRNPGEEVPMRDGAPDTSSLNPSTQVPRWETTVSRRLDRVRSSGIQESEVSSVLATIYGEELDSGDGRKLAWRDGRAGWVGVVKVDSLGTRDPIPSRPSGGVLRIGKPHVGGVDYFSSVSFTTSVLPLEWR
jgi:hypothetical protein